MLRRNLLKFMIASVCAFGLFSVAQARDLNEIIESKTIRIGVNPNFPPMSS